MNINTFVDTNIYTFTDQLVSHIDEKAIKFGDGTLNFPYAYGYLKSELNTVLLRLNLSIEQLRILEEYNKNS